MTYNFWNFVHCCAKKNTCCIFTSQFCGESFELETVPIVNSAWSGAIYVQFLWTVFWEISLQVVPSTFEGGVLSSFLYATHILSCQLWLAVRLAVHLNQARMKDDWQIECHCTLLFCAHSQGIGVASVLYFEEWGLSKKDMENQQSSVATRP
jgi:hypothetical protein